MLEEGVYKGRIKEWGTSESKNGKPRFEFTARLSSRENSEGDFEELEQPVSRTVFLYMSPAALSMTTAAIRSLGFTDTDMEKLHPDHAEAYDFGDVEVVLDVRHEEWEGKPKEKVELKRGHSRKLAPSALSAFEATALAFKAAQEKENPSAGAKEEPRGRRKKRQTVPADDASE